MGKKRQKIYVLCNNIIPENKNMVYILYPYVTFGEVFLKFFAKLFRNVLLLTRTITDAIWNPCHIAACCSEQQFHCYGVSCFDFD